MAERPARGVHPPAAGDHRPARLAAGLAAIGCLTLVLVGGAGHLSPLDQPERVTEALVAWASGED
jgi:pimeloyl-ACP methyl ester carboxylesterase